MQKLFFISFICFCLNSGALFAQNVLESVGKASKSAARVGEASRAVFSVPRQTSRISQAVIRAAGAARVSYPVAGNRPLPSLSQPSVLPYEKPLVLQPVKAARAPLQAQRADILRSATFMAEEFDYDDHTNMFSGTVFETEYNGKKEIFGVVATHAIAVFKKDRALRRYFLAMDSSWAMIPAEIVQLSSSNMLDIALVKFSPEYKSRFRPLRLAQGAVKAGDVLASQGFSRYKSVYIDGRYTIQSTPLSIRTTMPRPRDERAGLCGSAVVNKNNELVGIHTGSVYDRESEKFDIAYATHVFYLNKLVEAYHNGGKATFPLILNGVETIPLNVDEYIIHISMHDEAGNMLWTQPVDGKFPYSRVQDFVEIFAPRYITFVVRRAIWNPDVPEILLEDNHLNKFTEIVYTYDWQNQKIVSVSGPSAQAES